MNKINYSKELEKIITKNERESTAPSLLLHSCCAPCSSYCLEYLAKHFNITVFYYNPNISPKSEFEKRARDQQRLIAEMELESPVSYIEGEYNPQCFYDAVKGYENCREGSARCEICYEMRLRETAKLAKKMNFDYFCTTLTISPLKNAQKINEIGAALSGEYSVSFLPSDFKKKEGFKRSVELSEKYGLYRQNFCGCVFSREGMKND